ncbi:MAG: hypothetical protein VB082_10765 [Christensenella sp.]|nr:hypothetical protein [Christensenella sp.]
MKWEKRLAKGKKSQVLPQTQGAAENIMGGSTTNGTGMLYNKNNPNKMTKNGINLGASAYNYNSGLNLAAAQQYAAGLPEGMKDYLKSHPDETLPNGINGAVIEQLEKQYLQQGTGGKRASIEEGYIKPDFLKSEEDIKELQKSLNIPQTGIWDIKTDQAYNKAFENLPEYIAQSNPQIAGLQFNDDTVQGRACISTATNNALAMLGIDDDYQNIYEWFRVNGVTLGPAELPIGAIQYIKEKHPELEVTSVLGFDPLSGIASLTAPQDQKIVDRAANQIQEKGQGILCYTYDGGAHYVAIKGAEEGKVVVYDYWWDSSLNNGNGGFETQPVAREYDNLNSFLKQETDNAKNKRMVGLYSIGVR